MGSLSRYAEEFDLWASFSPLTSKAKHEFWKDANRGVWFVRSNKCTKEFEPAAGDEGNGLAPTCCSDCFVQAGPRKIQRRVVRFASKYYGARLLSARLFGGNDEVVTVMKKVKGTAFGMNNSVFWGKLSSQSNSALQQWVRRSFTPSAETSSSIHMNHWIASVVVPCLKINVATIDNNLHRLSAQFITALSCQQLTDS